MKKRKTKKCLISKKEPTARSLSITSVGLYEGNWGITLSDGSLLEGVEEIIQTKPAYSDGYTVTVKIFVPCKKKPITANAF